MKTEMDARSRRMRFELGQVGCLGVPAWLAAIGPILVFWLLVPAPADGWDDPCLAETLSFISRRHDVDDRAYIELAAKYPEVGRFTFGRPEDAGSCVLIDRQWILMASHNLMFRSGPLKVEFQGQSYAIDWQRRHFAELTQPNIADFNFDIALCHLGEPVNDVQPAALFEGDNEVGHQATIVGFGRAGNGRDGCPVDGRVDTKRACQNMLDAVGNYENKVVENPDGLLLFYDFDNPPDEAEAQNWFGGDNQPLPLEGMMSTGDSGGGVFVDTPEGRRLVGINSGCARPDGRVTGASGEQHRYGIISRTVRVSRFIDWIQATRQEYEANPRGAEGLVLRLDFERFNDDWVWDSACIGNAARRQGVSIEELKTQHVARFSSTAPGNDEQRSRLTIQNETSLFDSTPMWVHGDLKLKDEFSICLAFRRQSNRPACGLLSKCRSPGDSDRESSREGQARVEKDSSSQTDAAREPSELPADYSLRIERQQLVLTIGHIEARSDIARELEDQEWHCLSVIKSGTRVRFFLDDSAIGATHELPLELPRSDQPLQIGAIAGPDTDFDGFLDELMIYNRALTDVERSQIMATLIHSLK